MLKNLQARSCRVAIEWIERLRALVFYWKCRHKIDAKQEIELAQACRPRLTPQTRICRDDEHPPEAPPDLSALYPAMNNLYNWCVLEGCRPIVKVGRIYMKKGLHGQYKYVIRAWLNFMLKFCWQTFSTLFGCWPPCSISNQTTFFSLYICPTKNQFVGRICYIGILCSPDPSTRTIHARCGTLPKKIPRWIGDR